MIFRASSLLTTLDCWVSGSSAATSESTDGTDSSDDEADDASETKAATSPVNTDDASDPATPFAMPTDRATAAIDNFDANGAPTARFHTHSFHQDRLAQQLQRASLWGNFIRCEKSNDRRIHPVSGFALLPPPESSFRIVPVDSNGLRLAHLLGHEKCTPMVMCTDNWTPRRLWLPGLRLSQLGLVLQRGRRDYSFK